MYIIMLFYFGFLVECICYFYENKINIVLFNFLNLFIKIEII